MPRPQLRIYFSPDDRQAVTVREAGGGKRGTVRVTLGELFATWGDAVRQGRRWIRDFDEEEVQISGDLHEVLRAFQDYQRPAAS